MEQLAGLDSAFLAFERPSEHLTMGAVLVLEPRAGSEEISPAGRFAEISELVSSRVHLVPRFRQRVYGLSHGIEHPVWVDDPDFSIERHLRRAAVPEPGGRREIDAVVADLMALPLDHGRPLWEMIVLEGLPGGQSAVVARIHHAVLDGTSGAELLASFLDLSPEPRPVPPPPPFAPERLPSRLELLRHAAAGVTRRPSVAFDLLRRGTELLAGPQRDGPAGEERDAGSRPKIALLDEAFRAPHTSLNGPLSPQRGFAGCRLDLERVRRIGKDFEATVNDVMLAATGSALRRYLAGRAETPPSSLVAMMPVSTRRHGREPDPREGTAAPGNMLTAVFLPLGTDLASAPQRLRAVVERTREAKALDAASGGALLEDASLLLVPALLHPLARVVGALAGVSWLPTLCNLVVSNIAGPDLTLWFAGRAVAELYPVGPVAAGVGLNVTALSYRGTLHIGVLGCRSRVPDPERVAALICDGVEELAGSAL